jgi:hypothetical protein
VAGAGWHHPKQRRPGRAWEAPEAACSSCIVMARRLHVQCRQTTEPRFPRTTAKRLQLSAYMLLWRCPGKPLQHRKVPANLSTSCIAGARRRSGSWWRTAHGRSNSDFGSNKYIQVKFLIKFHCRSATQKWEVVAECARHLHLALRRVPLELRQPPTLSPAGGPDTADAPGTEVLLDMLGAQSRV